MHSVPQPPRTPLRRISQGSLFRLSHSNAYPDAPHGLGFLEPALSELVDEAEALHANVQGLKTLGDALGTFNESFASWLYVMNMNALTTDWPQAPTDGSFRLAARRAEEDAAAALAAMHAAQASAARSPSPVASPSTGDKTGTNVDSVTMGETTFATEGVTTTSAASGSKVAKKKGKPKLSVKEKKERAIVIDKVISTLPLEFRGSDPNLRRHMEIVIEAFFDHAGRGMAILEFVKPPDLIQARANKCLIALVNRKVVQKENSTGTVLYHWLGLP